MVQIQTFPAQNNELSGSWWYPFFEHAQPNPKCTKPSSSGAGDLEDNLEVLRLKRNSCSRTLTLSESSITVCRLFSGKSCLPKQQIEYLARQIAFFCSTSGSEMFLASHGTFAMSDREAFLILHTGTLSGNSLLFCCTLMHWLGLWKR